MKKREYRLFIRVTDEERNCILDKMYGFIYVDMDDKGNGTLERKPKKSYYWMKDVIASNGEKLWAE